MAEPPDLNAIVAQASTVDERLEAYRATPDPLSDFDAAVPQKRFAAWRRLWRTHPSAVFARRLACTESEAAALLNKVPPFRATSLPAWARALAWLAPAMSQAASTPDHPDVLSAPDTPFADLLAPIADSALARLWGRLDGGLENHVSEGARAGLRGGLLSSLARHCVEMIYAEFDLFRRLARTSPDTIQSMSATSRAVYDAFIDDYRDDVGEYLAAQPVLARILGTVVNFWLEEATELSSRLHRDRFDLRNHFGAIGKITRLEMNLSDPHRGRRHVAVVEFANGAKIVYKPRDVRVDLEWRGFLGWLADHGSPFELPAAKILPRDGYGWTEFIPSDGKPLSPAFYRHAGAFLAILHMFQARDFHRDNVVTANDLPVAIDLETLFHPSLTPSEGAGINDPATASALRLIADSVIGTNYLPLWAPLTDGRLFRMSGIDGASPARDATNGFRAVDTDAMTLDDDDVRRPGHAPVSAPGDDSVPLADQISALCEGFEAQYSFLVAQRDALTALNGPLARFRGLDIRVLIDGTGHYERVARAAQRGARCGDGVDWSLPFEVLGQDMLSVTAADAAWSIAAAQRNAMARLDIPFFLARTDATWIRCCDGRQVDDVLDEAPLWKAGEQLARFGPDDLGRQLGLIRAAVVTASQHHQETDRSASYAPRPVGGCEDVRFRQMVLAAACALAEVISRTAIRAPDGVAWIGIVPVGHGKQAVGVLGTDLHYGILGPALFLAAFARICGDAAARQLATAAVTSTRRILDPSQQGTRSVHRLGLGGTTGLGSILYGLVQIAASLEERGLLFDAIQLSRLITSERVAADQALTVSDGAAGAILGLLALYRATGEAAPLDAAIVCGRHLLACAGRASFVGDGGQGTPDDVMRFLHGVAGIRTALWQLSAVAGDDQFQQRAVDAWGAGSSNDDTVPEGIAGLPICASDSLVEGNCLILDRLVTAGARRKDWGQTAVRDRACHMMLRSQERGGFALNGIPNDLHPGLSGGLSGIGYTLLRLTNPALLPSVVMLQ